MVSLVLFGVWFFVVFSTVFITIYGSGYRLNTIPIKSAIESQFGMGAEFRSFVAEKYDALKSQFFITPSEKQSLSVTELQTEPLRTNQVSEETVPVQAVSSTADKVAQQVVETPQVVNKGLESNDNQAVNSDTYQVTPQKVGAYVTGVNYKALSQGDTVEFLLSQKQVKWTGFFVNKKKAWVLDIQGNWGIDTNNIWRFDTGTVEKVVLVQYDGFVRCVLWLREADTRSAPQISHSGNTLSVSFSR